MFKANADALLNVDNAFHLAETKFIMVDDAPKSLNCEFVLLFCLQLHVIVFYFMDS